MNQHPIVMELAVAERIAEIRAAAEREHIGGGTPFCDRLIAALHTARTHIAAHHAKQATRPVDTSRPAHG